MRTLRAYNECNVVYEYGKYNVGCGTCVKAEYGKDHDFIGVAYAEDIYTAEERTVNYIEVFNNYPMWYKGRRNYQMLKDNRGGKFKLNGDGNVETM